MTRKLAIGAALAVIAAASPGCAGYAERYPALDIDSTDEIVYSHCYETLELTGARVAEPETLAESETAIIAPRFSPGGGRVAYYDLGTAGLPVSSTRVALCVLGLFADRDARPLCVDLPQFDLDHRLMVDDAIPPLWDGHGGAVMVAHHRGIERIDLSGARTALIQGTKVTALSLSPDGETIVYADEENVYALDRRRNRHEALLPEGAVPRFGNRRVLALAFSPDGKKLALNIGHEVFVLDLASRSHRQVLEAPQGVYWLAWITGGREIAVLYGKENPRSFRSLRMADTGGEYTLAVIGEEGAIRRKLFFARFIDVRHAAPDLSPDARLITLTVRESGVREIVVVAVDGSGVALVTSSGPNAFASWRPAP